MNNAAEKPINRQLFDIHIAGLNISALAHIVEEMANEPFIEQETSDYLSRLTALATAIDRFAQEIVNQTADFPLLEQSSHE